MLIGLLVGIERERRSVYGAKTMGVRSFLLLSLVGAVAGGIKQPLVALGLCIFAALVVFVGYLRGVSKPEGSAHSIGITTEIAAIATFGLGYLTNIEPIISLILGLIMLLALHNKTTMHTFIKKYLKPDEVQAAAILLLLSVGLIPLIPDRTIDPLNVFNPHRLAVIIALIGGIQFSGYAASRIFGHRIGLPLAGFLAGNISSTATFATYSKLSGSMGKNYMPLASAATLAIAAMLCQVVILLIPISVTLLIALSIPLFCTIGICLVIGILLALRNGHVAHGDYIKNPLNLWAAIKLGSLLTGLIFIIDLCERYLGDTLTKVVTFLTALFELHGVVIANANTYVNHNGSIKTTASTVQLAIIATMVSKIALTAFWAQGPYRRLMLIILGAMSLLTTGFWLLIKFVPTILIRIN